MFPLYFALLDSVSPFEIVAHRVIWSLVLLCIIITITRGWAKLRTALRDRKSIGLLAVASVALSINWLVYVRFLLMKWFKLRSAISLTHWCLLP